MLGASVRGPMHREQQAPNEGAVLAARVGGTAFTVGAASAPGAWHVAALSALPERAVLLLATDGVADDLVRGLEGAFAHRLVSSLSDLPISAARRALTEPLIRWPAPRHFDDKTVALLWRAPALAA